MRYGSCPKTLDHRVKKEPHHRSRGFYSPKRPRSISCYRTPAGTRHRCSRAKPTLPPSSNMTSRAQPRRSQSENELRRERYAHGSRRSAETETSRLVTVEERSTEVRFLRSERVGSRGDHKRAHTG